MYVHKKGGGGHETKSGSSGKGVRQHHYNAGRACLQCFHRLTHKGKRGRGDYSRVQIDTHLNLGARTKQREKGVKGNFKQGNKTIFQAVNISFVLNRTRARSLCVPTF